MRFRLRTLLNKVLGISYMEQHGNQLPIPAAALHDDKATELLRVWVADGKQHVAIAPGVWDDAASWGIMLVDLAKHIANAYEQTTGQNKANVLARLRAGFEGDWES